jgi:hypothetical protein
MAKIKKETKSAFDINKKVQKYMLAQAKIDSELYQLVAEQRLKEKNTKGDEGWTWGEVLTRCLCTYLLERGVITEEQMKRFVESL